MLVTKECLSAILRYVQKFKSCQPPRVHQENIFQMLYHSILTRVAEDMLAALLDSELVTVGGHLSTLNSLSYSRNEF